MCTRHWDEDSCEGVLGVLYRTCLLGSWIVCINHFCSRELDLESLWYLHMLLHLSLLIVFVIIPGLFESFFGRHLNSYQRLRFERRAPVGRKSYWYLGYPGEIVRVLRQDTRKLLLLYNPLLSINSMLISFFVKGRKVEIEDQTRFMSKAVFFYHCMMAISVFIATGLFFKICKHSENNFTTQFRIRREINQRNRDMLNLMPNEKRIHTAITAEYNKSFTHGLLYTLSERMEHAEFKYFQKYAGIEDVESLFPTKRFFLKCARCEYETPSTTIALPGCGHTYHDHCFLKGAKKNEYAVECEACQSLIRPQMIMLATAYEQKYRDTVWTTPEPNQEDTALFL